MSKKIFSALLIASEVFGVYQDPDQTCGYKCAPATPYGCAYAFKTGTVDQHSGFCSAAINLSKLGNDWHPNGGTWQSDNMRPYLPAGYTMVFRLAHAKDLSKATPLCVFQVTE